ncbi:MAG: hypothetical protein ACREQ9_07780, partial [Candidatus Binatia bacterium]
YEMDRFGAPVAGAPVPLRDDARYGTLLVCPGCDAEHLTYLDDRIPDTPPVRRVRGLKPRE